MRGFDFLIQQALEAIAATRSKRTELEQQRGLLQRKLAAMKRGNWGLEGMLAEAEHETPDLAPLEEEIEAVEGELGKLGAKPEEVEQSIQRIINIFGNVPQWLDLRKTRLSLNDMSVMTADAATGGASQLELDELFSSATGGSRILLPGRFPRIDLPAQPDFFKEAQRYLQ